MAKRTSSRGTRAADHRDTTPRHLWLAALGALAVAGRRARAAAAAAAANATGLGRDLRRTAGDARDIARGAAMTVGERLEPRLRGWAQARTARPARRGTRAGGRGASAAARRRAGTRVARKGRG